MKLKRLTATILLAFSLAISAPVVAQNPPAKTYQPGFWQPVARVDLNRPVEIKLINETDLELEYDLTANYEAPPQPLGSGETVTLIELPLPAYLLINPQSSLASEAGASFNLKFDVVVNNNNIVLVKIQKVAGNNPGNTTFNLHETGAIYIY